MSRARHVTQEQYERIKILLELNRSDADIAVALNLSKTTVGRVRRGEWRPASTPPKSQRYEDELQPEDSQDDDRPTGTYVRCPGCGGKVLKVKEGVPCVLCNVNAFKKRLKEAAERQGCPS